MSLSTTVKQGSDLYFLYTFLKRLTTPFDKTKAFEFGIIDDKGKVLRKRSTLKTSEERASYTLMDTLIFNMKKLMAKIPFGSSKLMSYAASLFLLKERKNLKMLTDQDLLLESFQQFYTENIEKGPFVQQADVTMELFEQLEFIDEKKKVKDIEEDVPANVTGPAVAGTGDDSSTVVLRKRKRKKKHNIVVMDNRKFILYKIWKEHFEDMEEFDLVTGIGEEVKMLMQVIPNEPIFIENDHTGEQINIQNFLDELNTGMRANQRYGMTSKSRFVPNMQKALIKNRQSRTTLASIRRAARSVRANVGVRG